MHRSSVFDRFSKSTAHSAGHPLAFVAAVALIVLWLVTGPLFGFSDTWQLAINTATTIVTFLMVFVIQNTQNRDGAAIQIKLDELIRAAQGAHNGLLDLEELSDGELQAFRKKYLELADEARAEIRRTDSDTGTPAIDFPS
ncbi:MAG: low affinity iron permease family protein [Actinobacteria bacterium]|nr:MAG: low affinity iron permease family protein [Actinomycetota bacterium]